MKIRTISIIVLYLALFAAGRAHVPASQAAAPFINERQAWSGSAANQCTGETVQLSGSTHLLGSVTTDANGGQHFVGHVNLEDSIGIGVSSGSVYHAVGVHVATTNRTSSGVVAQTDVFRFPLVTAGGGNNVIFSGVVHLTVLADGTVVAEVGTFALACG